MVKQSFNDAIDVHFMDFDDSAAPTGSAARRKWQDKAIASIDFIRQNDIIISGSNRQSALSDAFFALIKKNGLSHDFFSNLAKHKKASFDPWVMQDLINAEQNNPIDWTQGLDLQKKIDYPLFTIASKILSISLMHIIYPTFNRQKSSDFIATQNNQSKTHIIIAHAYRLCMLNPNKTINLHFYDDRKNIVDDATTYFQTNQSLLPHNITLHINHRLFDQQPIKQYTYQGKSKGPFKKSDMQKCIKHALKNSTPFKPNILMKRSYLSTIEQMTYGPFKLTDKS
jgi:hypothetical protein